MAIHGAHLNGKQELLRSRCRHRPCCTRYRHGRENQIHICRQFLGKRTLPPAHQNEIVADEDTVPPTPSSAPGTSSSAIPAESASDWVDRLYNGIGRLATEVYLRPRPGGLKLRSSDPWLVARSLKGLLCPMDWFGSAVLWSVPLVVSSFSFFGTAKQRNRHTMAKAAVDCAVR